MRAFERAAAKYRYGWKKDDASTTETASAGSAVAKGREYSIGRTKSRGHERGEEIAYDARGAKVWRNAERREVGPRSELRGRGRIYQQRLVAGGGATSDPVAFPAVERDVGVSDERHQIRELQAPAIGDMALGRRENRAAEDRHDQKR